MPEPTPKHRDFRYLSREPNEPTNGEPPLARLVENGVTPNELFYVRSHAPAPVLDAATHQLHVGGLVERPLDLSLDDLRQRFESREVEATLLCAGNRRDELAAVRPIPGETPWGAGAISNAVWEGVALRAVLHAAGIRDGAEHVELVGLDEIERDGAGFHYGSSVPLEKALDDVVLAWAMNGEPLPRDHGFPLRAVVPGYIGARSVKWLARIELRREPSENHYQQRAYKLFPPQVDHENVDWDCGQMLGELSLTSAICTPPPDTTLSGPEVHVAGYAMAGGNRVVARVEVSHDGGETWLATELDRPADDQRPGVWTLWSLHLELPAGSHELLCRAWDSAANVQPERAAPLWNFKGYMSTAWHRVRIQLGTD